MHSVGGIMVKPIIVGVGQRLFRPETVAEFVAPFDAMKLVVETAALDAGVPGIESRADALHVVNMLGWRSKDPPTSLAEKIGAHPKIKEYTAIGGNTPQWLVNRAADNLAAGKCGSRFSQDVKSCIRFDWPGRVWTSEHSANRLAFRWSGSNGMGRSMSKGPTTPTFQFGSIPSWKQPSERRRD